MALESANFIAQLVFANPADIDAANTLGAQDRNIKRAVYQSFPNVGAEVSASAGELNYLRSATGNLQTQLNLLKSGKLDASSSAAFSFSASYAQSAGFAASATNATSAVFATSATNATNAVNATNATNATNASVAQNAVAASSAIYLYNNSTGNQIGDYYLNNANAAINATNSVNLYNNSTGNKIGDYYLNASNSNAGVLPAARLGLSASGFQQAGNVIMAFGTTTSVNSGASLVVTYAGTFTNQPSVVITARSTSVALNGNANVFSDSPAGFTVYNGTGVQAAFNWVAIGPSI